MRQLENLVKRKISNKLKHLHEHISILGLWKRLRRLVHPIPPDSFLEFKSPPSYAPSLMLHSKGVVKIETVVMWLLSGIIIIVFQHVSTYIFTRLGDPGCHNHFSVYSPVPQLGQNLFGSFPRVI